MRKALRLLGLMIAVVFAVGAAFVGLRFWEIGVGYQFSDRTFLYMRAFDKAAAQDAGPSTVRHFWLDGRVLPGLETGAPPNPCPLDQKALRSQGPGHCYLAQPKRSELPDYCFLVPCVAISVSEDNWKDPAIQRAAAALKANPDAVCRALKEAQSRPWRDKAFRPGTVIDCGPWRAFRGAVFLQVFRWGEPVGTMAARPVLVRTVRLS